MTSAVSVGFGSSQYIKLLSPIERVLKTGLIGSGINMSMQKAMNGDVDINLAFYSGFVLAPGGLAATLVPIKSEGVIMGLYSGMISSPTDLMGSVLFFPSDQMKE